MVRATGADSSCIVERSVLPLIIIDGGAGRGRMRAVRADAPEEAGEERRDADPPLLEGERDVGMRGMLTGMLSKLLSQVGAGTQADVANAAAVEELAAVSDEEWEAADFQAAQHRQTPNDPGSGRSPGSPSDARRTQQQPNSSSSGSGALTIPMVGSGRRKWSACAHVR